MNLIDVAKSFIGWPSDPSAQKDCLHDLGNASQREYRRLKAKLRTRVAFTASNLADAPRRIESWGETPDVSDHQIASDARLVATRAAAVSRQIAEEHGSGGNPKRADRTFGRRVHKKRGA